jgi:hypothetical protein
LLGTLDHALRGGFLAQQDLAAGRGWLILYAFTGIQLAWVLRPFRGTEGYPVQFFRPEAFEQNAYVVLIEHALRLGR